MNTTTPETAQQKLWKSKAVAAAIETACRTVERARAIAYEHGAMGIYDLVESGFQNLDNAKCLAETEASYWENFQQ